jgi:hypothetical protein
MMAENGLMRRLEPIDARLTDLYAQRLQARIDFMKGAAATKMAAYATAATNLADLFAEVLAVSENILAVTGEDPGIVAPQSLRICLPGFIGQPEHLMTAGNFSALKNGAALRVQGELKAGGVL